ncbi:unnamed protein product [Lactuca saligna]|uniref:LysM domain-containing protein n=1 Tax=Lactuca saligna TaxID=75948 RepID=A0AA36DYJ0_LACSI|nr:unnamed protein product [Lactuca saligna]
MQHSSSGGDGSDAGNGGSGVGNGGFGCIQHTVSKYDTLAGVAIKYGVEVADIKKMNGLTTDLQMFSRKLLKIPLPGRHPPSPIISNGHDTQGQNSSEMTPPNRRYSDSINSLKSLKLSSSSSSSPPRNISSSIDSLRDYYRLTPNNHNSVKEGSEMTQTPLGLHRKSKSENNGFSKISKTDVKEAGSDKSIEKLVRRRKSEVDLNNHTPDMMMTSSAAYVKGLGLRPKISEGGSDVNNVPVVQAFSGVRKSSSAPTFQLSEAANNSISNSNSNSNSSPSSSSSFWPMSMLNFTLDLQAAITSPLFDGLPKPTSGRKKKPARD